MPSFNLTPESRKLLLQHLAKGSAAYTAVKRARQFLNHVAPGAYNFIVECDLADGKIILEVAERYCAPDSERIRCMIQMAEVSARSKSHYRRRERVVIPEKRSTAPLGSVPEPQSHKTESFKLVAEVQDERPLRSTIGPRRRRQRDW